MALTDTARLIASLELDPRKFNKGLSAAEKRLGKAESTAYRAGQNIGLGIRNLARVGVVGATAIGGLSIASLKVAGDFEAQLNTINTIARETPKGLKAIGDSIRGIARATGTPLEELTQGYYDLLSAGIAASDAQKVLAASNRLAIGGLASTAETVDLLTTAINSYGFEAKSAGSIADVFAKAIERGKLTAADLAATFAQVAPIAKASGIGLREISAGFARLTASGVPAAEAATQMRSAIISLTRKNSDLKKLEKQTGRNYIALAGRKGLVVALEQLRKDADKAGVPLIDLLGRVEGLNFLLATTGPNLGAYNEDLAAMGDAAGTAAKQMAERQKGLNFQVGRLKALARDAGITIGSELLPKITPLFERFNKALADPKTQAAIRDLGTKIAALFSDKNIGEGIDALKGAFQIAKDAAPTIADAARISGEALKIAIDAFKTLPPEIQKLAIAGLAINKVTGGLVTTIAGGLISSVLKQLVSGVVNVKGAVVNVSGAVGPGVPGGGKGGGIPGAVKTAATGAAALGASALGGLVIAGIAPVALSELTNALIRASGQDPAELERRGRIDTAVARGLRADTVPILNRIHGDGVKADRRLAAVPPAVIRNGFDVTRQLKANAMTEHRQGERIVQTQAQTKAAVDASKARLAAAQAETRRETTRGAMATAAAARSAGERARGGGLAAAAAINRKNFSPRFNIVNNLRLSIRDTAQKLTFQQNAAIYG
jgi:TP901 family phage tail tape measure protein